MSIIKILVRLKAENAQWRRQRFNSDVMSSPLYIDGAIHGFARSIKIIEEYFDEERQKRPKLSRWQAADLRKACQTALHQLKSGDKKRAEKVLERILGKVR